MNWYDDARRDAARRLRQRRRSQETTMIRVLGPHERGRFVSEAWGHLLAVSGSGALDPAELEQVSERALLQFDGPTAIDDLRALMEGTGFSEQGPVAEEM